MTWNLIYILGWIHRKWGESQFVKFIEGLYDNAKLRTKTILALSIAFVIGCIGLCSVSEAEYGEASFSGMPASVSAAYSLINGDAKTYDNELTNRADYLSTTPYTTVTLPPLSAVPDVIFHSDITSDPMHWKNQHLCLYYNKQFIWIEE